MSKKQKWIRVNEALDRVIEAYKNGDVKYPLPDEVPDGSHVYLLASDNGLYKIGIARSLKSRVGSIQTASPIPISLVASIATNNPRSLEGELHKRFASKRKNGEWFNLTDNDLKIIRDEWPNFSWAG